MLDFKHFPEQKPIKPWIERKKYPRASHRKTSLEEFHFNWKKKVKRYK